jgi:hypothetical protein
MAEGDEPLKIVGEFSDYNELISALRVRAAELNLSGQVIDNLSGLPDRYAQKLLGPAAVRRLGMTSLGPFFGALAVRALLIEDKAAAARLRSRVTPRQSQYARRVSLYVNGITDRKWARIQKLGRQARWEKLTKAQRREIMRAVRAGRKAAAARWKKGAS